MTLGAKKKKKPSYNVERGFLSKLLETKDFDIIKEQQIKPTFFIGDNRRVFTFIRQTLTDTGEFPSIRVLEQKFPSFTFETYIDRDGNDVVGTEEPLSYWAKELRNKQRHNKMAENIEAVVDLLEKGETEEAFAKLKQGVWSIEDEVEETQKVDITQNTESRKERYLERKKNKGMQGIPTGIEQLDYVLKGLVDDTLTTLIAKTGTGKTWFLVLVASYAMLNGYKVCFFTTEMSKELLEDRFDAMLYGMMYEGFNYSLFKQGMLSPEEEQSYFDFLDEDVSKLESLVIEDVIDVAGIISTVQKENPDLICVDSAYLMDDVSSTDSDWLRVTHITRDLKKKVAKHFHKPVLINSQADKTTSKKNGPELGNISYSQSIGMDSDNVLALYRDQVMLNDREMGVKVLKNREGTTGKAIIEWDFTKMSFKGIYSESEEGDFDSTDDMSDNSDSNVIAVD